MCSCHTHHTTRVTCRTHPPPMRQHVHHRALTRVRAGDALQVFIASFDSSTSPALSKAALTAYAVLLFIGSRISGLWFFFRVLFGVCLLLIGSHTRTYTLSAALTLRPCSAIVLLEDSRQARVHINPLASSPGLPSDISGSARAFCPVCCFVTTFLLPPIHL